MVLGSDCSREEWQQAVERALELAPTNLHILQAYRKPRRVRHAVYDAQEPHGLREVDGRLRLCPYYFIVDGKARLSGGLATFCPPDKKIIHGMQDAALLPVRVVPGPGQPLGACAWMSARRFSISFSLSTRPCSTFLRSLLVTMLMVAASLTTSAGSVSRRVTMPWSSNELR